MDLYLRKVIHPQAHDNYLVILKRDDGEFEIGSIGIRTGAHGLGELIPSFPCGASRPRAGVRIAAIVSGGRRIGPRSRTGRAE